jgi:hypothetical protein
VLLLGTFPEQVGNTCKSGKSKNNKGVCVTQCGLAIYMKKYLIKAKRRRIMETQIFHHAKI